MKGNSARKLQALITTWSFPYSFRNVFTGFALAAFMIVELVVKMPTAKMNNVHRITVTIPTGI
jgi:hypothetical protein